MYAGGLTVAEVWQGRGFIELDSQFRISYASPDAIFLTGKAVEPGTSLSEVVSNTSAASAWAAQSYPDSFETTWQSRSGRAIAANLVRVDDRVLAYLTDSPRRIEISSVPPPDSLRRILNMKAALTVAFTLDGKVYAANLKWTQFFGLASTEIWLPRLMGQLLETPAIEVRDLLQVCKEHFERGSVEHWLVNSSGERRWTSWTGTVDETRNLIFMVGTDLTDQKRKADEEAESREDFDAHFASASVGVCHIDLSGRYIRVNQKFQELLGYSGDELSAMTYVDITHPDDLEMGNVQTELLLAGDLDRFSMEKRYIRKDGEIVHTHLTVSLIRDDHGNPKMVMSAVGEINANADTDSAVRKSEQYYRAWFDPTDRTYWTADPHGAVLEISNNGGLTIGVDIAELVQFGWREFIHPEDLERVNEAWLSCLASGQRYHVEYRIRVFQGGYHWVRSQALPYRDDGREILCWYGYTDDIHFQRIAEEHLGQLVEDRTKELRQANEALIEARDEALAASISKSQFLANISHEIRTPMNGVIGIASMLQEQVLDEKSKNLVGLICRSGEALVKIIDDILDFSKIEAGKVTLEPSSAHLLELVSEVMALFQAHAKSKKLDLKLESKLDSIPVVRVDPFRLRQVLSNLISNAIKFTPSGWVKVEVAGVVASDLVDLTITVRDSGIGIRQEHLSTIFESFTQGDGSIQRKYGGTGLGLTISKNLAELMGGTLIAESQIGVGTAMVLCLPLELDRAMSSLKG